MKELTKGVKFSGKQVHSNRFADDILANSEKDYE